MLTQVLKGVTAKNIKSLADNLLTQYPSSILALATVVEDSVTLVIAVSDELTEQISAVEIIQHIAPCIGAKGGGGRKNMAQTGGKNVQGVTEALSIFQQKIRSSL